jgi:nitrogen-specific signal transduction histidine kinase
MEPNATEYLDEPMNKLRHDIKNQLSGITLALAQLKYEIQDPNEDCLTYLDMIATSCDRINDLVKNC